MKIWFSQRTKMIGNPQTQPCLGLLLSTVLFIGYTGPAFADDAKSVTPQQSSILQELEHRADSDLALKHLECIDEYRDCLSLIPNNAAGSLRIALLKKLAEALALDEQSQQEVAIDVVTNIRPRTSDDLVDLWNLLQYCSAVNIPRLAIGCDQNSLEQLRSAISMVTDSQMAPGDSSSSKIANVSALKDKCLHYLEPGPDNGQGQEDTTDTSIASTINKIAITKAKHRELLFSETILTAKGKEDPGSNNFATIEFDKQKIALSGKTITPSAWEVGPQEFDRILKQKIDAAFDSAKLTDKPLGNRILLLNEFADRALAACRFDMASLAIKDAYRLFEDEQNPLMPLYLELIQKSIVIELTRGKFDEAKGNFEEWQHLVGTMDREETEALSMIDASWQGSELLAKNKLQEKYKYWRPDDLLTPLSELTQVELAELYDKYERPNKAQAMLTEICQKRLDNNRGPNLRACGLLAWTFETLGNSSLAASTITQALNDAESQDYFLADTETAWVDYYAGLIAQKENNGVRARRYYHQAEVVLDKLLCSNGPLATRIKRQMVTLE